LAQTVAEPLIVPGVVGIPNTVTVIQDAELLKQVLESVTQMLPPADPTVTVMEVVPCPEVIVHPVGTVQLYERAPLTGLMKYTRPDWLAQTVAEPVIAPGVGGVLVRLMVMQLAELLKHVFESVTQMVPADVPEVTLMVVVPCPEVMVQPDGTVQL
jgi:hypothetical protein